MIGPGERLQIEIFEGKGRIVRMAAQKMAAAGVEHQINRGASRDFWVAMQSAADSALSHGPLQSAPEGIIPDLAQENRLGAQPSRDGGAVGPAAPNRLIDRVHRSLAIRKEKLMAEKRSGFEVPVDIARDAQTGSLEE